MLEGLVLLMVTPGFLSDGYLPDTVAESAGYRSAYYGLSVEARANYPDKRCSRAHSSKTTADSQIQPGRYLDGKRRYGGQGPVGEPVNGVDPEKPEHIIDPPVNERLAMPDRAESTGTNQATYRYVDWIKNVALLAGLIL